MPGTPGPGYALVVLVEPGGWATELGVAVALVERTAPDVAVVDVNLPGADGVELIRRLAGPPRTSRRRADHAQ